MTETAPEWWGQFLPVLSPSNHVTQDLAWRSQRRHTLLGGIALFSGTGVAVVGRNILKNILASPEISVTEPAMTWYQRRPEPRA